MLQIAGICFGIVTFGMTITVGGLRKDEIVDLSCFLQNCRFIQPQ